MNPNNECMAIQARVEQVSIIAAAEAGAAFQVGMRLQSIDDPKWVEIFALTVDEARRLSDGVNRAFETIKDLQAQN